MLIVDRPENDIMGRVKDLEEYILRIESSRTNLAVRLEEAERRIKRLETIKPNLG